MASEHIAASPLLRVAPDADRQLRHVCETIITDARAGRATTPAAEWLLENYSYLRTQIREIKESLPRSYYRRLPRQRTAHDSHVDVPRIYGAVSTCCRQQLEDLDGDMLLRFFEDWQQHTVLSLAELWAIRPMLKIALLRMLVEVAVEGRLEAPEAEEKVRAIITALRSLDDVTWPEFVEKLCVIDRILRNDPAAAYSGMDFETRDRYRRAVEEVARHTRYSEQEVSGLAVELARESDRHVGYFLVDDGLAALRRTARAGRSFSTTVRETVLTVPEFVYLAGAALLTSGILWSADSWAGPFPWWFLALLFIPATHAALAITNLLVSHFLKPRIQLRMDFRNGIPDDCKTVVVVPTLLLSKTGSQRLVDNLEIYYLANRDRNLFFGLLTDCGDAASAVTPRDAELIEHCAAGIRELNRRYRSNGVDPFFLCHRDRFWNESEGKWMGRERKRGKLDDFNHFLLGHRNDFARTEGQLEQLRDVRYCITLDSDTQLPRDTAWKLVGTMAHPLNRPVIDSRTGIVKTGFALMQPRIGISMESASKSRLAAIYSGQTGFDPYTTAVSDVYQDLFGRATFTGKGIYDVAIFAQATENRFPDNTLLSHDLIEGEHVRAGLVTDLEMIDDYPSRYQAFSKRKHRWVRGDWQIAMWLLPRVPNAQWKWVPNRLPFSSRWKIFDNLRRSTVEIFLFLALLAGWLLPGPLAVAATLAVLGILLVPIYAELAISLLRLPPLRFFRQWAWTRFSDFTRAHLDALLTLVFLPVQALLMGDAIVRTLYRRLVSGKNLLEWETMAQAEMAAGTRFQIRDFLQPRAIPQIWNAWSMPERYLAIQVALAAVIWLLLAGVPGGSEALFFAVVIAWLASPGVIYWLNSGAAASAALTEDREFLRSVSLSTWRYFTDHESAEDNWLAPDNLQEDPPAIAHRTSPTNLGLQLNALIAAQEFGYLTQPDLVERLARVHRTMARLERDRGHFYNWYDTRTLEPLHPRFLSTVDSGNLAASLIITKQGCLALLDQPLIGRNTIESLRDHVFQLRESIPISARTSSVVRLLDNIRRQIETEPDDLFFWESILTEVRVLAGDLRDQVEWVASKMEARAPRPAEQMRYWMNALIDRADFALRNLCELAPWLCPPFETELRLTFSNPQLAELKELLRKVPTLKKMGELYGEITASIDALEAGAIAQKSRVHQSTLTVLRSLCQALGAARHRWEQLTRELESQAALAGEFERAMDFRFLYDERRKLLRIGWSVETGKLENSTYDLLASEARTAVFLAIARGDAPREAWFHLGRKLTYYRGHRTLISWSGTMFEYLMPALFMNTWEGTLLGESLRSVVKIQRLYARERHIPWGISESAHSGRDVALNYQYRAFGVPCCGLDRIAADDLVIAPYATVMSLMVDPKSAVENLRNMAARGWLARYGFYEAIDFRARAIGRRKVEVIRAFMVHHQGMSFLALANALLGNPIQKLFHSDPMVLATELLLQERMPALAEAEAPEEPFPGLTAAVGQVRESEGALQTAEQ